MKYNVYNIALLTPGKQVENAIIKKYGSLEAFAAETGRSLRTIERYKSVKSLEEFPERLKGLIFICFEKDYRELCLSEADQLKHYLDETCKHITEFDQINDAGVFTKLIRLCTSSGYATGLADAHYLFSIYYNSQKKIASALEQIGQAVQIASGIDNKKYLAKYLSQQGLYLYFNLNFSLAYNSLSDAIKLLPRAYGLDPQTLHLLYYRLGFVCIEMRQYESAIEHLLQAKQAATCEYDYCSAINNIGVAYKKMKRYDEAIKFYKEGLAATSEENRRSKSILYNNIAELYRVKGEVDTALEYIDKAILLCDGNRFIDLIKFYETYTSIQILRKQPREAIRALIALVREYQFLISEKSFIFSSIKLIADFLESQSEKESELIMDLTGLINELVTTAINSGEQEEYIKSLKSIYYDITFDHALSMKEVKK